MNLNTNTVNIGGVLYQQDAITGDLFHLKEVSTKKKGKGRPPSKYKNQNYNIIRLVIDLGHGWLDDIVYGSCNRAAGTSNGKINVSIRDVIDLLRLPEFSSKDVGCSMYTFETSDRRQQLVAQAARHALNGIAHHLHQNPNLKEALDNLWLERFGRLTEQERMLHEMEQQVEATIVQTRHMGHQME